MPHRARGRATRIASRPGTWRGVPALLGVRMRVWAGSLALDCRLAEGVSLTNSPELALRAQQLASDRSRRALSSALTAAVDAARRPCRSWAPKPPIAATGILDAAAALESVARDLMMITDPPVRGVALVSFLVCDPTSPLYNRHSPVSVGEITDRARSALKQAYVEEPARGLGADH